MAHDNPNDPVAFLAIVILLVAFLVYFLPTWIALARHHPQVLPLFLANLFLGATGIIWVLLLLWAVWRDPPALGTMRRTLLRGQHR